uniref:Ig-like domain-containing protein n=1 Tax=Naja naja TaxID=35670 RepID=A0A8C6VDE0_NAJNA
LLPGLLPSTQAAFLQSQLIAPNNLGSSIYLPREDGSDKDHSKGSRDWRVFSSGLEGRAKLRLFGKLCIFCDPVISAEPIVTVTSKAEIIQTETHICRVDGFFPKDINATWRKDGEIWLQDTLYGLVVPNSDGTYHFWLSIRINPNERNHFQCHVEHDSMKCPLQVVLMVPGEYLGRVVLMAPGEYLGRVEGWKGRISHQSGRRNRRSETFSCVAGLLCPL